MTDIVMPRLSDTMEEGTILRWLASDGEQVHRGQELVEIETDKATMVYESDAEGILATLAQEGQTLPVGELIARVGDGAGAGGTADALTPVAVAEDGPALGGPAGIARTPIACLGVQDFGQSGDVQDLYRYFGIDADTIVSAALDLLG